jgi:sulfite reductase (NADPH) flavoprotein alpha-component
VKGMQTSYTRNNPFNAKVLKNINLNGIGSNKETRHLEISLEGSGLTYEPGDCLGIIPENDLELVENILKEMDWDGEEHVTINKQGDKLPLKKAMISHLEITLLTKKMVQLASQLTENEEIKKLVLEENVLKLKEYIQGRDLLDLLKDFGPWNGNAQDIVSLLRNMPPRLYSIASSMKMHPEEVHLTIGAVRYTAHGRERKGVCSILCAERIEIGDTLPVFIQQNKHFHLPKTLDSDVIMVGPGTGIAPFRSFIEDRAIHQSKGKTWLFFGDQHKKTDFLYENEWNNYQKDGFLTNIDTAFSRDAEKKLYVQHKMLEQSGELFQWLNNGAYFYVCGDREHMAKDVHEALLLIVEKEGNKTRDEAEAYVKDMQTSGRYQRDVY